MKNTVYKLILMSSLVILSSCGNEPASVNAQEAAGDKANLVNEPVTAYVALDKDLSQLKQDFNNHQDQLRLLFIVGPTCGICLRGMADINDEFLHDMQNDPRLHTFVVHVPVLRAQEKDVEPVIPLLQGPRISHYWDESGHSGRDFQKTLGIDVYAWDVWLIFDPDATWEAQALPPRPVFWHHQLHIEPSFGGQRLDKKVFANEVKRRIADITKTASVLAKE